MTITLLDSTDKLYGYIADVGKNGVKILPLDINKSESGFVAEPEGIRFALLAVKSLGEGAIDRIVSERKSGGAFRSLQDFCTRVSGRDIHLRTVEALIKSGAFDCFGYTRREHLNACEDIMKSVTRSDGSVIEGQLDLFGMGAASPLEKKIERCGEFDEQQLLEFEHEALGMYISAHPIDRFECVISAARCVTSAQLIKACTDEGGMADKRFADGAEVDYAGMVRGRKMLKTKKGDMMCFVELEDKFGTLEIVVFPSVFQTMGGLIKDRALLHVKGKISCKEEEEPKILADMLEPVDRFCSLQLQRDICVRLVSRDTEGIKAVRTIAEKYRAQTGSKFSVFFSDIRKMTGIKSVPAVKMCPELLAELENRLGTENVVFMDRKGE